MRWPWKKRHEESVPEVIGKDEVDHSRKVAQYRAKVTGRTLARRAEMIRQNRFTEDYGDAFYGPLRPALRRGHR